MEFTCVKKYLQSEHTIYIFTDTSVIRTDRANSIEMYSLFSVLTTRMMKEVCMYPLRKMNRG